MNPYLAGFGLGLVLLASYILMGRGLGASGAVASFTSWGVSEIAPSQVIGNGFFEKYLDPERAPHPLKDWLVFEVIGVMIGGFISGAIAKRVSFSIDRGAKISDGARLFFAFIGGSIMAVGAQFARGCTSGQALSGGSLLNLGSWVAMICIFGGGYLLAWFVRRLWQ
ncbi:MAG: YeeE/YedE family protein [Geobacteraceae bacterium]|nr:YeeE/YedE family protein [Geobacteraceae bacterium]